MGFYYIKKILNKNIIHRDLKMKNIFVNIEINNKSVVDVQNNENLDEFENLVVKIGDFGSTREFLTNKYMTKGAGTIDYQAYEV